MIHAAARAGQDAVPLEMIERALAERSVGHLDQIVSLAAARTYEVFKTQLPGPLLSTLLSAGEEAAAAAQKRGLRAAEGRLGIPFPAGTKEYAAEYYRRKKAGMLGREAPAAAPPAGSSPHDAVEAAMRNSPQHHVRELGGGVSETRKVTLRDGRVGVFKPGDGESKGRDGRGSRPGYIALGLQTEREVAAWEVAKAAGFEDLVPETVARTIEMGGAGKRGSFQLWQEGDIAMGPAGDNGRKWGQSTEQLEKAAMFDYVIGNMDRHDGNWIVGAGGKLRLIDHGLSFPEKNGGLGNRFILERMVGHNAGMYGGAFSRWRAQALDKTEHILSAMRRSGLSTKSVDAARERLSELRASTSWEELRSMNAARGWRW